ncbi:bactofilin family protein [Benzoatithermus flavus]|uniref:Polymer-forming cytoskeletal protein n=1 Tax=Benzoatithermus flavus TaxID=3108223 RepID=A0ABU8XZW5_9PROT
MFLRRKKHSDVREPLVWVEEGGAHDQEPDGPVPMLVGPEAGTSRPVALTAIGPGMKITGDVEAGGKLQISGRIEGRIHVPVVEVDQPGVVVGEIHADTVIVAGIVTGRIEATEIHLTPSAQVVAELLCAALQIDKGASFEGQCQRFK